MEAQNLSSPTWKHRYVEIAWLPGWPWEKCGKTIRTGWGELRKGERKSKRCLPTTMVHSVHNAKLFVELMSGASFTGSPGGHQDNQPPVSHPPSTSHSWQCLPQRWSQGLSPGWPMTALTFLLSVQGRPWMSQGLTAADGTPWGVLLTAASWGSPPRALHSEGEAQRVWGATRRKLPEGAEGSVGSAGLELKCWSHCWVLDVGLSSAWRLRGGDTSREPRPGGRGAQSRLVPPCLREAERDHQRLPPAPPSGAAAGRGPGPTSPWRSLSWSCCHPFPWEERHRDN